MICCFEFARSTYIKGFVCFVYIMRSAEYLEDLVWGMDGYIDESTVRQQTNRFGEDDSLIARVWQLWISKIGIL